MTEYQCFNSPAVLQIHFSCRSHQHKVQVFQHRTDGPSAWAVQKTQQKTIASKITHSHLSIVSWQVLNNNRSYFTSHIPSFICLHGRLRRSLVVFTYKATSVLFGSHSVLQRYFHNHADWIAGIFNFIIPRSGGQPPSSNQIPCMNPTPCPPPRQCPVKMTLTQTSLTCRVADIKWSNLIRKHVWMSFSPFTHFPLKITEPAMLAIRASCGKTSRSQS